MSGPVTETALWSNRRWFLTILLVFVAQAAAVFYLTGPAPRRPAHAPPAGRIRLISGSTYETLRGTGSLADPTLFALAHPKGFSGDAWLQPSGFPYQLTNQIAPPLWLPADSANLAEEFRSLMQTNVIPASLLATKPPLIHSSLKSSPPRAVLRPKLRIEGEPALRRLLTSANLPEADPAKILTNCVISVMVGDDGEILSAFSQTSSGSMETDREALSYAFAARFAPVAGGDRADSARPLNAVFGQLVFEWVLAPEAPEGPAAAP